MTEIIVTTNAPEVIEQLKNLDVEIPEISLNRASLRMQAIKQRLQKYPPAPSGSTYIRTMGLRDAVTVSRLDDGYNVTADPVSPKGVHYGKYPLGNAEGQEQAWMHVGRWPLIFDVVSEELETLSQEIEAEILASWEP